MILLRVIFSRLKKHSFYHLIIPLLGGISVEYVSHRLFKDESLIVSLFGGVFWFRTFVLVGGVGISWLVVMLLLINHETDRRVTRRNLMKLEKRLNSAKSYYGVSVISLENWFDPRNQLYLAKLLKRKLEADDFEHDRTLIFFSERELKNTKQALMDEGYYGHCLALLHGDYGIPLSFLSRRDIFEILEKELDLNDRIKLGCYPGWINWRPLSSVVQNIPLHLLRRRLPQLDFALMDRVSAHPRVIRVKKSGPELRIEKGEMMGDKAATYLKLVEKIRNKVYDNGIVRTDHDFLADFGPVAGPRHRRERDYRRAVVEQCATTTKLLFKIKRYTRFVQIAEASGDVSVREDFEGVTAYPGGSTREKLPRTIVSRFGHLCKPTVETQADEGRQVGWVWESKPPIPGEHKGFITFDPPVEDEPVNFTCKRMTHNGIYFNQRDRQGESEEVSGKIENLIDIYVLKVRFPSEKHFPKKFSIHVTDHRNKPDFQEQKLALTRFARFASDYTATLILDRPLPGYTYRIMWTLPQDDIEQLSARDARIAREANRRLLSLSSETERATRVAELLGELQSEINTARFGKSLIDDPKLEVVLHVYSEQKKGLVIVASNSPQEQNSVAIGTSAVGQAYKRRALVSWSLASNSDNARFWDYSQGHTGVVSIPLFFPLHSKEGARTGVLSIATRSPVSGFLNVIDDMVDRRMVRVFTQHINAWYAKRLAAALGLPDLSQRALILSSHKGKQS